MAARLQVARADVLPAGQDDTRRWSGPADLSRSGRVVASRPGRGRRLWVLRQRHIAENGLMHKLITTLWRSLRGPLQWRILYFAHAKFMVGVTVACWNENGEVLLMRHRFWPAEHPWGLPSGYARRGEELAMTAQREVREEAGYEIAADPVPVDVASGYKFRIEVLLNGAVAGGGRRLDKTEIDDAGFFGPDEIPDDILPSHREKIERAKLCRHQR